MEARVDGTDDEELHELIQRTERRRHTAQEKERRARHANAQLRHRLRLKNRCAPTRTDFATVTLGIVLLLVREWPDDRVVKILRAAIEEELVEGDFDRNENRIRLERVLKDCARDLTSWRHGRRWKKSMRLLWATQWVEPQPEQYQRDLDDRMKGAARSAAPFCVESELG
jgi:hypothetical protein